MGLGYTRKEANTKTETAGWCKEDGDIWIVQKVRLPMAQSIRYQIMFNRHIGDGAFQPHKTPQD